MRCRRNGRPGAPTRVAGDARPRAACVILMRDERRRQGIGGALRSRWIVRVRACRYRALPKRWHAAWTV